MQEGTVIPPRLLRDLSSLNLLRCTSPSFRRRSGSPLSQTSSRPTGGIFSTPSLSVRQRSELPPSRPWSLLRYGIFFDAHPVIRRRSGSHPVIPTKVESLLSLFGSRTGNNGHPLERCPKTKMPAASLQRASRGVLDYAFLPALRDCKTEQTRFEQLHTARQAELL